VRVSYSGHYVAFPRLRGEFDSLYPHHTSHAYSDKLLYFAQTNIIGYIVGVLTLLGYLPQTVKTIRTHRTKDLSMFTFLTTGVPAILWTLYGLGSDRPAIWLTNGVVAVCSLIILSIKLKEDFTC
jgi:MtN3 and saliva related transmembrane protein